MGWLGRPGASDILEPDWDRAWFAAKGAPACCMPLMELVRFMADEGMGIDVRFVFMGASVCARGQNRTACKGRGRPTYLAADREEARLVGHGKRRRDGSGYPKGQKGHGGGRVVRCDGGSAAGRAGVRACDVRDDVGSVFRCLLFVVGAAFVASAPATARALIGPSTLHAGGIHTYLHNLCSETLEHNNARASRKLIG